MKALSLFLTALLYASNTLASVELEAGFLQPPDSAKPHTWWHWMNGHVTREGITGDLESMKAVGIGGFQAFHVTDGIPPGPVGYMSDEWWALMDHTLREAERLDLKMCFHNCAGWSSSGGPWITPEFAMQEVVVSEQRMQGPMRFESALETPEPVQGFYRDIAVIAFPTLSGDRDGPPYRLDNWKLKAGYGRMEGYLPDDRVPPGGQTIDPDALRVLTISTDASGQLNWDVPPGDWTVLRFGYRPTGRVNRPAPTEGQGLECDKLSKAGADLHWENSVAKLLKLAGARAGQTFNNVLIDSYEVGHQNWSHTFAREFRKRRGYDVIPYLPALTGRIVRDVDTTERFLWDFRRTIADLFAENYYGRFAELCHRHGLSLSVEPYGRSGNFDDFAIAGSADIPMGEWWPFRENAWHHWSSKHASSSAHIYGRTIVGAEAFTGPPDHAFEVHPFLIKAQGDYFFCRGVNRYVFHTFVHKPYMHYLPGMTMGPHGSHFNRGNTWWSQAGAWMHYIARSQFLLQQGQFAADLLYFPGEDAPLMPLNREQLEPRPPEGFDYDFVNRDRFMRLKVKQGRLVLPSGMEYRVLVLPPARHMRLDVLEKVASLVADGAMVVGPKPVRLPGLEGGDKADQRLRALASRVWGEIEETGATSHPFKKGRVFSDVPLETVLADLGVPPDFQLVDGRIDAPTQYPGNGIEFIHRTADNTDLYFVANQHYQSKTIQALFRVNHRLPEVWHPDTGVIEPAPIHERLADGRVRVPLNLDPAGSVFVVFRGEADREPSVVALEHDGRPVEFSMGDPLPLEIHRAVYGAPGGGADQQVEVTAELRRRMGAGRLDVVADNRLAGDPARLVVKQLEVEYSLGDQKRRQTVAEGQRLVLGGTPTAAATLIAGLSRAEREVVLTAREPGEYVLRQSDGSCRTVQVDSVPKPVRLDGPWNLAFPSGWGAPALLEMPRLASWTEHPDSDVKHFSGTATYTIEFELAATDLQKGRCLLLELGDVRVMAEVILNGRNLGVLWKAPYSLEVTEVVRPGRNQLEVRVTNLWINRLIGDAAFPDDVEWAGRRDGGRGSAPREIPAWAITGAPRPSEQRKAFATWRHFDSDDPVHPSGLLGPVMLSVLPKIQVQ